MLVIAESRLRTDSCALYHFFTFSVCLKMFRIDIWEKKELWSWRPLSQQHFGLNCEGFLHEFHTQIMSVKWNSWDPIDGLVWLIVHPCWEHLCEILKFNLLQPRSAAVKEQTHEGNNVWVLFKVSYDMNSSLPKKGLYIPIVIPASESISWKSILNLFSQCLLTCCYMLRVMLASRIHRWMESDQWRITGYRPP